MSEWLDNQKQSSSSISEFLQERIGKANLRRKLTAEETKRFAKLEAIADKLKRGENVQNRQLQTWLSEDEYAQLELEWQEQLELRSELKDKPSDLKRYEEKLMEKMRQRKYVAKEDIRVVWGTYCNSIFTVSCLEYWPRSFWVFFAFYLRHFNRDMGSLLQALRYFIASVFLCCCWCNRCS